MKKIEKQIDKLWKEIEKLLHTKEYVIQEIKSIRMYIRSHFDEGSENRSHLLGLLSECHDFMLEMYEPKFF